MDTVVLNGFSCGIVRSEEIPVEKLKETRREWSECGMTCWTTDPSRLHNRQALDGEYNRSNPSQLA